MSRRKIVIVGVAFTAVVSIVFVTYVTDLNRNLNVALPSGCAKPSDGFLIVASNTGYNDSIAHGAPDESWPIITVHQGQNVTIVMCNVDLQAHGFQITQYYDKNMVSVIPGQVIKVSFVADKVGSYIIFCQILCSVHIYMQNGLLNVTPS